ncbi:MAG: bifunctional 2-polyprenyl-6-hydroxyphenol methylase/3-demethylubiquinol 3-O-methyltransferase UbiG [Alphaproteobacteria bacterium]
MARAKKNTKNKLYGAKGDSSSFTNNISDDELAKFQTMAEEWWRPDGAFRPLHELNPIRCDYIQQQWQAHCGHGIAGKKILDIGCGGGLLSVALYQWGGVVLGIDAEPTTIKVARTYQAKQKFYDGLTFDVATPEILLADKKNLAAFDMVLAMEVIEHVMDGKKFVANIAQLVKPDGLVIFSTINRNLNSFLLAIVGAEYILHLLPKGTHQYRQFVRPEELSGYCRLAGLLPKDLTGLLYNPLLKKTALSKNNFKVNYFLTASF